MRASEPSDRNYEIFCDVEWGGHSLRAAAEAYGLSPTRIQQIVAQVRHWYNANLPTWVKAEHPVAVACVAKRLFEERSQFLYNETMSAWRDSRQEFTIRREKPGRVDGTTVTTSRCFGQARYIAQAMRVAESALAANYRHAMVLQRLGVQDDEASYTPPEEVCAREDDEVIDEATTDATSPTASTDEAASYAASPALASAEQEPQVMLPNPVRSRLQRKLTRHEKRKAARERKRQRRSA